VLTANRRFMDVRAAILIAAFCAIGGFAAGARTVMHHIAPQASHAATLTVNVHLLGWPL